MERRFNESEGDIARHNQRLIFEKRFAFEGRENVGELCKFRTVTSQIEFGEAVIGLRYCLKRATHRLPFSKELENYVGLPFIVVRVLSTGPTVTLRSGRIHGCHAFLDNAKSTC